MIASINKHAFTYCIGFLTNDPNLHRTFFFTLSIALEQIWTINTIVPKYNQEAFISCTYKSARYTSTDPSAIRTGDPVTSRLWKCKARVILESQRTADWHRKLTLANDCDMPGVCKNVMAMYTWCCSMRWWFCHCIRWSILTKRFIQGEDRTKGTLLPELLDDYVSDANPVRVIDVFVECIPTKPNSILRA